MTILELKARIGELFIEKSKTEDYLRRINEQMQSAYNELVKAEQEDVGSNQPEKDIENLCTVNG